MTQEGERLARLEEQLRNQEEQVRQLWPLVAEFAVLREKGSGLRDDFNSGMQAMREEIAAMKTAAADRAKERRTMLIALMIAGIGLLGTFAAQLIHLGGHP